MDDAGAVDNSGATHSGIRLAKSPLTMRKTVRSSGVLPPCPLSLPPWSVLTRISQAAITLPLRLTNRLGTLNVLAKVIGGGVSGQAGAIVHATARALLKADESNKQVLREAGLLTRDAREKERKKYGLKKARKAPQYTKR